MAIPIPPAVVAPIAYKYYRITVTKNAAGNTAPTVGFVSINTFGIFETATSTANLALTSLGAGASATSANSSNIPNNAVDGNASTLWQSSASALPHSLTVTLPTAKIARKFSVESTTYFNEAPAEFQIRGSNDNVNWTLIVDVSGWNGGRTTLIPYRILQGVSVMSDGVACPKIDLMDWNTRLFRGTITPDDEGRWSHNLIDDDVRQYMIIHYGLPGFKPQIDGPVRPYKYDI